MTPSSAGPSSLSKRRQRSSSGTGDAAYRTEGWDFILAGGGLFNNLDYSFTVGHEDGTFRYPATQPGERLNEILFAANDHGQAKVERRTALTERIEDELRLRGERLG